MEGIWIKRKDPGILVIYVHGILSSSETCWTNPNGNSWPELLKKEFEHEPVSIYLYKYETGIFSGKYNLGDIVDDLKERMRLDGLFFFKSIVFVCHSMGGIVVRKLIVERAADFIENKIKIGLFLVASPSLGSSYADWLSPLAKFLNHSQAKVLQFSQNNLWINDLDKEFQNLKESQKISIIGKELVEDKFLVLKGLFRKQVVEPFSGARYFGERYKVPHSDHFTISKPDNNKSIQHRLLCEFIKNAITTCNTPDFEHDDKPTKITCNACRSTNDESLRLIENGQILPFILHAWNQTQGRGKLDRVWQGGAGVLTATWNYNFKKDHTTPEVFGLLSIISALAVRDAVEKMNSNLKNVKVKWPNDVLIENKKVAGILIDLRDEPQAKIASIGIGVNVCRAPALSDRKQYALPPASIFSDHDNDKEREIRIERTLNNITESLEKRYSRLLEENGIGSQQKEWELYDVSYNSEIELKTSQHNYIAHGVNKGINSLGQLIVEFADGERKEYFTGELSSVRGAFHPDDNHYVEPKVHHSFKNNEGQEYYLFGCPFSGTISYVPKVGTKVLQGEKIFALRAMKMETPLMSPATGVITEVYCELGQAVQLNQTLARIQRSEPKDV